MKCTNKKRYMRRNRKRELTIRLICGSLAFVCIMIGIILLKLSQSNNKLGKYETLTYSDSIYQAELFANDLCVTTKDVDFDAFQTNDEFHGALLFDIDAQKILYSENAHERLYPASLTKILTSYVALKYGELEDVITVSQNAVDIPSDSSSAQLQVGDKLTLKDLLYALMLPSGNDSAVAIAEYISGTPDDFANLMNKEAKTLGATNTHFVNPHGYQDKEHYTTAYDLYLIFNECIKNQTFVDIISSKSWTTNITQKDGSIRGVTWTQSNQFINGSRKVPSGLTIFGGKTGTTFDAGACLALYGADSSNTPYIAIIMGASSKRNLYDNMTFLLAAIPD